MASLYTFGAGAFTTLFPVFGKKMLALGPVEVGYLWSWLGIGLFLVSLALVSLTQWETRKRLQVVSVSSVIGGAALCGLVWTQSLVVATCARGHHRNGIRNVDAHRLGHDPGILAGPHGGARHGDLHGDRDGDVDWPAFLFSGG